MFPEYKNSVNDYVIIAPFGLLVIVGAFKLEDCRAKSKYLREDLNELRKETSTYSIMEDGAILCHLCGHKSYNKEDIIEKYCPNCNNCHDYVKSVINKIK